MDRRVSKCRGRTSAHRKRICYCENCTRGTKTLVLIRAERTKVTVELHVYTWTGFGRSSSGGTSVSELSALSGESVVRAMVTKFEAGT